MGDPWVVNWNSGCKMNLLIHICYLMNDQPCSEMDIFTWHIYFVPLHMLKQQICSEKISIKPE